jgi:hypothetical protein
VGPGGSQQDAAFSLRAAVPAGAYHVECDAVITASIDVTFSLIWRRGATDTMLAQWTKHWDPLVGGRFDAQPYEVDMAAPAITYQAGDQLVFRYAGNGPPGVPAEAFIPNGDGVNSSGRIPSIALPH